MNRQEKIKLLHDVQTGKRKIKKEMLFIDDYNCEPGFYRLGNREDSYKIIDEKELDKLRKLYEKILIYHICKPGEVIQDSNKIIVDSPETAETFKKLRNGN